MALLWIVLFGVIAVASTTRDMMVSGVVRVPIGTTIYDVTHYGAKGDGTTLDTASIQKAFDACGANPSGGQVLCPTGHTFLSMNIAFKGSHCALVVVPGAILKVSNDREKWPGFKNNTLPDFITAKGLQHLAITGGGLVDGDGSVWWAHINDPRPRMVSFSHVTNVLISNITFKGGPTHNLEMFSDHTEIAYVNIFAPPSTGTAHPSHNTDAVDVHGSPFYVHHCTFNVGDDNIAQHSNDTLVENCHFGSGHGASIGSLCNAWVRNVTFRDITFNGTTAGCRIKTDQGCAGLVTDVRYQRLTMTNVHNPIQVTMFYHTSNKPTTLRIENIQFQDITCTDCDEAGSFDCTDDSPCHHLSLDDVKYVKPKKGFTCSNAFGTTKDVTGATSCLKPDIE